MADGIEARSRRIKRLLKDRGIAIEKPRLIRIDFSNHTLDAIEVEAELLGPSPETAYLRFNVVSIPTGLHLAEGTHWHPTKETRIVVDEYGELLSVTVGRQVPNLIGTEEGAANVEARPAVVDVRESATGGVVEPPEDVIGPDRVTATELEMARKEAAALREASKSADRTTPEEKRIWGGIGSRRTDRRIDTSWLWPNRYRGLP
jgi:hypothetical protein